MSEQAKFCPRCGSPTELRTVDNHERAVCERCGHITYRNPVPAAGIILIEDGNILMVRRKFEPRAGLWTLPAGFLEYDEHVEACAVREAEEETGLRVELTRLFGAYMAMDDPRVQVVLLLYLARRIGGKLTPGDDASEAAFFALDATPEGIAFKAHEQALADVRRAFAVR
ncbi:MAG TPA: NUDIX hydrolase [Candidatus Krumholzibacteria bacterium]|nr:NUDIX hydrolase [Candidatus Krumholzibacteria bacterium]